MAFTLNTKLLDFEGRKFIVSAVTTHIVVITRTDAPVEADNHVNSYSHAYAAQAFKEAKS